MAQMPEKDEHGDDGQKGRHRIRDDVLEKKSIA
jgi:hypothetical protein